jgi:murein DD-endopeptidase MepM/ murein hydrolase activator NlpD
MANVSTIQEYGNQLKIIYDDGTNALAYPTTGGLWIVSAPSGPPIPSGDDFSWPYSLTDVSSEYGPRTGPIGSFHEGIDFSGGAAVTGAKNYATHDGTVELVNINSNYGYSVQLYHGVDPATGYGLHTIYAHFNASPLVHVGDSVSKGDVLGYLGASGDATGAHLHFETHTCPSNGPIRHNTTNTSSGLAIRTAINPRDFMTTYGDGAVIPQ